MTICAVWWSGTSDDWYGGGKISDANGANKRDIKGGRGGLVDKYGTERGLVVE